MHTMVPSGRCVASFQPLRLRRVIAQKIDGFADFRAPHRARFFALPSPAAPAAAERFCSSRSPPLFAMPTRRCLEPPWRQSLRAAKGVFRSRLRMPPAPQRAAAPAPALRPAFAAAISSLKSKPREFSRSGAKSLGGSGIFSWAATGRAVNAADQPEPRRAARQHRRAC